jgi:type II secretory pathway pseudopilin PulG
MYYIVGADGKEYGPISLEQLKQWANEGRANSQTKVRRDSSMEWQPLGMLPEFSSPQARSSPPPISSVPASSMHSTAQKTSGMAITSLVVSLLGVLTCGFTGPIGVILGIVSLSKINKSRGTLGGNGLAIAGIAVGGVMSLIMIPLMAAMLLPALAKAKERANQIKCMNHARQINLALQVYASENGGVYPPSESWCDALTNKVPRETFQCPSDPTLECAFAFNSKLGGRTNAEAFPSMVVVFSSDQGWNASGGSVLLSPHRHSSGQATVSLADGSSMSVRMEDTASLKWEP